MSGLVMLAVASSVAIGLALAAQGHPPVPSHDLGSLPASLETSAQAGHHGSKSVRVTTREGTLFRSVPRLISIPAIGVRSRLMELGTTRQGTVQVPSNYAEAGWYHLGPSPGELGAAVILGHVDSLSGPAVFFNLGGLKPGDSVYVTLSDGIVARFVVDAVDSYLKTSFPSRKVYETYGRSTLQLVTCTGQFDYTTHHYLSNLVVYTSLASATFRT